MFTLINLFGLSLIALKFHKCNFANENYNGNSNNNQIGYKSQNCIFVSDWAHFFIVNVFSQFPPFLEKIIQSARPTKSIDSLQII